MIFFAFTKKISSHYLQHFWIYDFCEQCNLLYTFLFSLIYLCLVQCSVVQCIALQRKTLQWISIQFREVFTLTTTRHSKSRYFCAVKTVVLKFCARKSKEITPKSHIKCETWRKTVKEDKMQKKKYLGTNLKILR